LDLIALKESTRGVEAGPDPTNKFRGGDFSNICQSHYGFSTVREIKYIS